MRGERSELLLVSSCRQNSNRSLVGRVLTRQLSRRSLVGRVLTRRSSADIKIKSFRAVMARATFLCLCKETWRKETHPACAPGADAPGPRSRRDFPRRHPASAENAAHPCAAPLRGLVRRLRRSGGAPEVKIKINGDRRAPPAGRFAGKPPRLSFRA